MAVTFVGAVGGNGQDGASFTVTRPAAAAVGDLMIAIAVYDRDAANGTLMSMPAGWTLIGSGAGISTIGWANAWYKVVGASEPTSVVFTNSSGSTAQSDFAGGIVVFRGHDTSQTLAVTWTTQTTLGTTQTAPSVSGVTDGMLFCGFLRSDSGNATATFSTYSGGLTEAFESGGSASWVQAAGAYVALATTAATGTKTAVCTDSSRWITASIAINPAAAGAPQEFTLSSQTDSSTLNALTVQKSFTLPLITTTDTLYQLQKPLNLTLPLVTTADTLNQPKTVKNASLGLQTDGSTINALSTQKKFTLGLITQTSTVNALTAPRNFALASITDSNTLNALSAKKPLTLSTVADSNSLNSLATQKRASIALVASSDTPNAAKAVKTNALSVVTETHTLNSLIRSIGATLNLITSSDTPNGLSTQKRNGLGSVTVSEVLNVLRMGRGYNLPSITDGASLFALTGQHRAALSLITDSSTINGLAGKKLYTLGQIIDTSGTVQPLGETGSFNLGQTPVELAELFPLAVEKRCSISSITDATTVTAPVRYKSATLSTVTPTDIVNPLGYGGSFTLGLITASSTLFGPSAATTRSLGLIVSGSDLFVPTLVFDVLYAQLYGSVTQEHLVSANVGSENNSSAVLAQKNDPVRADISVVTIEGSVETSMLFANAAAVVSKGGTVVTETIHGEARNA